MSFTWQVNGGALPAGLSLDAVSGTIFGTPTQTESANFTVQVEDELGSRAESALAIEVKDASEMPPITVWVDDQTPAGAVTASQGGDSWQWVSADPSPYAGSLSQRSALLTGMYQHNFYDASATLVVEAGDTLFAYVWLDPAHVPSTVALQWRTGTSWDHRAYWGANVLPVQWGTEGAASRRYMGALPPAGGWVRLEVPASAVGLEGAILNGMAFTLVDGSAAWDYAGVRH